MRLSAPIVIGCLSLAQVSLAIAADPFIVITTGGDKIGFKADGKLYTLGMDVADFKAQFGPPDKEDDKGNLYYFRDGVTALVINGKVENFAFCLVDGDTSAVGGGKYKAANVKTDAGVASTSTKREVVKLHGQPLNDIDLLIMGTVLQYDWGTISFNTDGNAILLMVTRPVKKK